jgi:hypothetical protein
MGCGGSKPSGEAEGSKPKFAPAAKEAPAQGGAASGGAQIVAPPEQVVRIVLKETLLSLKPKAAKNVTSGPDKEVDATDWQKCAVKVEEGEESLILHYTMAHYKGAIALAQWGKSGQTVFLEVGDLPPICHRDDKPKATEGGENNSAEGDDDTKATHSFIVSWKEKEGGSTNRLIFGCKDEDQCDSWKHTIRQYCNIKKRFMFTYMWKLNSDVAHEGAGGTDIPKSVQNLNNWRYRLFSLHEQKTYVSEKHGDMEGVHAVTYVSEKNGAEFSIACVLGHGASKAKVTSLPPIILNKIEEKDVGLFKTSVEQYRVATGYHNDPDPLPTQLHAILIEWHDYDEGEDGEKRVILAAAAPQTSKKWIEMIEKIQ